MASVNHSSNEDRKRFDTRLIQATANNCPVTGAGVAPIYASSTFVFDDLQQAANRFAGTETGFVYTRLGNPTQAAFERAVAILEEGEAAVAFASGMGAIAAAAMTAASAGDHMICPVTIYGSTHDLFYNFLQRFGIEVTAVAADDLTAWRQAARPNTRILYTETPANPTMELTDLRAFAALAKELGAVSIVDNTFASPYLQRPLTLGVDVVVHSATKYISGHGDVVAGVLAGSEQFCRQVRSGALKAAGAVISPFDAWLLMRGLKTLSVRMERQQANAGKIARFLAEHPAVTNVYYPGLPSFPRADLVARQMDGPGSMLSFEVAGGWSAAEAFLNRVRLCRLAVSLGDVTTLIQHPASMTHASVPIAERQRMGVTDGLIRLSVGLEDAADIVADLEQALAPIGGPHRQLHN